MATVTIRDLARKTSGVVDEVIRSGRPAVVTRHGRPVVALIRFGDEALEDFILVHSSEFVEGRRAANEELARGETRSLTAVLADLPNER